MKVFMLVLACQFLIVWAQCPPDFDCSGDDCYLIYSENGDWKYKEPDGDTYDSNSRCYIFIRSTNRNESCIDTQHECEQVGGNITAINSQQEYNQLTKVLYDLNDPSVTFNVYVDGPPRQNVDVGCAQIEVYEPRQGRKQDDRRIKNKGCFTKDEVDTIVCEFSVVDLGICLVSTTDTQLTSVKSTTTTTTTPSDLLSTSGVSSPALYSSTSTLNPIGLTRQTTVDRSAVTYPNGDNQNLDTDPDLLVTVGIPVFVFAVGVIVTFTCCIRYRRSKHQDMPESVSYSNGATIHEHSTSDNQHPCEVENILYDTGMQLQSTSDVQDTLKPREEREMRQDADNFQSAKQSTSRHNRKEEIEDEFESKYLSLESHSLYTALDVTDIQHGQSNRSFDGTPHENTTVFTQDGGDVYDSLNVTDMQQEAQEENAGDFPNGFDETLYANTEGLRDDSDVYDTLNDENMNLEPGGNNGKSDGEYDLPYSTINNHSEKNNGDKKGDIAVCEQNEYGKLNAPEKVPSEGMYAYVDTALPLNLVEENAYDKLQRNLEH